MDLVAQTMQNNSTNEFVNQKYGTDCTAIIDIIQFWIMIFFMFSKKNNLSHICISQQHWQPESSKIMIISKEDTK